MNEDVKEIISKQEIRSVEWRICATAELHVYLLRLTIVS